MAEKFETPLDLIRHLTYATGKRGDRLFTGFCVDTHPSGRHYICGGLYRQSVVSSEYVQDKPDPFYMHMPHKHDLPYALIFGQVKWDPKGLLCVSGGAKNDGPLSSPDVMYMDPFETSPTWKPTTPMPGGRFCHAMSILPDSTLFVSGGWYEERDTYAAPPLSSIIKLDVSDEDPVWERFLDMPEPRWAHTLHHHSDGFMYVFGGIGPDGYTLSSTFRFDPYSDMPTIDPLPDLPEPCRYPVALTLEDSGEKGLYVFVLTNSESLETPESYTIYRLIQTSDNDLTWEHVESPPENTPWNFLRWKSAVQVEIPEGSYVCVDVPT